MVRKSYKGAAVAGKLVSGISSGVTSFNVDIATGWPDGITPAFPFVLTIGRGRANEEKVLCSSRSGTAITVAIGGRGFDGTAAAAHVAGEDVEHTVDADTLSEVAAHIYGTGTDHSGLALSGHTHTLTYGVPVAVGVSNIEGADTALARRDHVHQGPAAAAASTRVICTSGTRPAHVDGLEIAETDTKRLYISNGVAWVFVGIYSAGYRGWNIAGGATSVAGGAGFSTVQWTSEAADSDAFIAIPNNVVTIPAGMEGPYIITVQGQWPSSLPEVNLVDLVIGGRVYRGLGSAGSNTAATFSGYLAAGATIFADVLHANATPRIWAGIMSGIRLAQ